MSRIVQAIIEGYLKCTKAGLRREICAHSIFESRTIMADPSSSTTQRRPKIAIIGAGFGGITAARKLAKQDVDITLIDRRNYHLFQPLLYQVATADLSPADVAWPIRSLFSKQKNVRVCLSEVLDVDTNARQVIGDNATFDYDYLIVASGARHSYFGNDQWEPHAPGLKRVIDATEIRKRLLFAFEHAEVSNSTREQDKQLTFVVVGGGPTGVEMAGAIAELARFTLASDFERISPKDARIILIEAGPGLLGGFPEKLSAHAKKTLEKLGVEVRLDARVTNIDETGVSIGEEHIPSATVIWGAGVQVRKVKRWLGQETDRTGRIPVDDHLALENDPNVFVIGDAAKIGWKEDKDVPGIAPAAKQAGSYVANIIKRDLKGKERGEAFCYRHYGSLATIGRHSAVIDFGKIQLKGGFAWWLWGTAHIFFLIGGRSPFMVATKWFWSYLTYSRGARLITGLRPLVERDDCEETPAPVATPIPVQNAQTTPSKNMEGAQIVRSVAAE